MLIMVDDEPDDQYEILKTLVDLSYFACSVIIVAIGKQKFKFLKTLDYHLGYLKDGRGEESVRHICQFI